MWGVVGLVEVWGVEAEHMIGGGWMGGWVCVMQVRLETTGSCVVLLCFQSCVTYPVYPLPPPQTYEAATFSPLCLCDYCPRAYHLACLAPPTPPLTSSTPLGEAKGEEPATAAAAAVTDMDVTAAAAPACMNTAAAPAVESAQENGDAVMEDAAGAAAPGPGQGEAVKVEGGPQDMKAEGGAQVVAAAAAAAAAAATGPPELQGEVAAGGAPEEGDGAAAVVVVVPQFSYAALEGATWACPHCQEKHRRVLEG